MKRALPHTTLRSMTLVALLVSCAASRPAPKPVDPLQGLEDCPKPHEVALNGADLGHVQDVLAGAEADARAERGRCAPAMRECVSSCAAYTARCSKPYVGMNGRAPDAQASASEFCDGSCDGTDPYLALARFFDGSTCGLSATIGPAPPVAE
ncbi:MAG TPA: hypothetical protein VMI54_02870 [Polyangiaceae bacterium]|nr:hypothetical protein [Polyangiaceae bacterium]